MRLSPPWTRRGQGVVGLQQFIKFLKFVKKEEKGRFFFPLPLGGGRDGVISSSSL